MNANLSIADSNEYYQYWEKITDDFALRHGTVSSLIESEQSSMLSLVTTDESDNNDEPQLLINNSTASSLIDADEEDSRGSKHVQHLKCILKQ